MIIDLGKVDTHELVKNAGFRYRVVKSSLNIEEQKAHINTLTHNAIFFQLDGEIEITWDRHKEVLIRPGDIFFLPRGANVSACIVGEKIEYIAARLEHDLDTKKSFKELLRSDNTTTLESYTFKPLPIKKQMKLFVESLKNYIIDGVSSPHFQNIKLIELYIIFKRYYSKCDCVNFFYPILKQSSQFKTFILDNYKTTTSIDDLVQLSNMSCSTFDRKFKEAFGTTPLKWIDAQTYMLIMRMASEPNVAIKDIMYEVGIVNPSQFTHLCKRLCGVTPSELINLL